MSKKTLDYEDGLVDQLKDSELAVEYLNASLEDEDEGAEERFLIALRHVAKAHGMSVVSEKSGVARQALYRALSEKGNPELSSLKAVLDALGLKLAIESKIQAS